MNKKLFVGAFLSVITLLVCSTTMSVAWYASSDVLKIENFQLELSASKDLFISTSSELSSFKKDLSQSELKQVDHFQPVSSMCSNNWISKGDLNPTFYGSYNFGDMTFDKEGNYVVPKEQISATGFYSQELYLYSESNYLAVLDSSSYILPDIEKNTATAKKLAYEHPEMGTEEEILADLNSLVNSARISVLTTTGMYAYKIIDPYKNSDTYLGGLLDTDLNGFYDTWTDKDRGTYEILFGDVGDSRKTMSYTYNAENIPVIGENTWYNSGRLGQTNIINDSESIEIKQEKAFSIDQNQDIVNRLINGEDITSIEKETFLYIPVKAFQPTRFVLSIYFEGWDTDNLNCTMSGSFVSQIAFNTIDYYSLVL